MERFLLCIILSLVNVTHLMGQRLVIIDQMQCARAEIKNEALTCKLVLDCLGDSAFRKFINCQPEYAYGTVPPWIELCFSQVDKLDSIVVVDRQKSDHNFWGNEESLNKLLKGIREIPYIYSWLYRDPYTPKKLYKEDEQIYGRARVILFLRLGRMYSDYKYSEEAKNEKMTFEEYVREKMYEYLRMPITDAFGNEWDFTDDY